MFFRTLILCAVAIGTAASSASAFAQASSWIGRKVYLKYDAKGKVGTTEVDLSDLDRPVKVTDVDGDWLWVEIAWIDKSQALSYDQYLDYDIEYWNDALREDPADDLALLGRAMTWAEKKNFDAAIRDFTAVIRLDSEATDAYVDRAMAWKEKGNFEQALSDCETALRIDPSYVNGYVARGVLRREQGDYERALSDFREALRVNPKTTAWADAELAWLQATCPDARFRDGRSAVEHAAEACEKTEWSVDKYVEALAAAYAEAGDFDNAVKRQREAVELAPHEAAAAPMRARLKLYETRRPFRDEPRTR